MRCATVYQFRRDLVLHALSKTTDGVWVLNGRCEFLPVDASDEVLGRTVRAVLEESQSGVPHPTDFRGVTEPLLRAAGVKSWNTFAKSAVCVEVEEPESGVLKLIPTENQGVADGFVPEGTTRVVRGGSDAELGKALREVIAIAS